MEGVGGTMKAHLLLRRPSKRTIQSSITGGGLVRRTSDVDRQTGGGAAARLKQMTQLKEMHLKSLTQEELRELKIKPNTFLFPEATRHPHNIVFEGPRSVLDEFVGFGITGRLQMLVSPFINVTIPPSQRAGFGLHQHADYFAFVYPAFVSDLTKDVEGRGTKKASKKMSDLSDAQINKLDQSTISSLLLEGGFMYVNSQGVIQDVRAVMDNGPTEMTWATACVLGHKAQEELINQGRFMPVKMAELRNQGALSFAWINPGEFERNLGAQESPLGAFAYTPSDGGSHGEEGGGVCGSGQGVYFALTLGAARSLEERVDGLLKEVEEIKEGGKDGSGWRMKLQQDKAQLLMFDCVEKCELSLVRRLLESFSVLARALDSSHRSMLQHACHAGSLPMVELLLEWGATVTLDLAEDGAVKGVAELQEALKYNNHALALKLLPHLFVESSSEALYQTVVVINHAYCLSRQMLSNDTDYAERLHTASDEAQLVGAALLDTLSDGDLVQLLQSDRATEALREAVKSRAMYLVGRPRVQVYLRQIWRGRLFHQLISGKVHTPPPTKPESEPEPKPHPNPHPHPHPIPIPNSHPHPHTHPNPNPNQVYTPLRDVVEMSAAENARLWAIAILVILPCNLLLLPLVVVFPSIEGAVSARLPKLGGRIDPYLPDSSFEREGYSQRYLLYWESAYVLNVPIIKYILYSLISLGLALAVTIGAGAEMEKAPEERSHWLWVMLFWTVAAMYSELEDIWGDYGWWSADELNYGEIASLTFATTSLALMALESHHRIHVDQNQVIDEDSWLGLSICMLLATSVITMWMTQGLRLMQISTWLGPLVRMVLEMATDVLKWLCLLLVFLLAFAASFYSIFVGGVNTELAASLLEQGGEGAEGGEGAVGQLAGAVGRRLHADHFTNGGGDEGMMDEGCQHLATKYGSNVFRGMKELFEITLGGAESGLECLDELRHPGTSTFVMSFFLISSVVLLLNMLIAMMAKTFDRVFDKQPQVYQYMFAMLTLNWMAADATPPPFNMLRVLKGPIVWVLRACAGESNGAFRSFVDELEEETLFSNDSNGREDNKDQNVALAVGSRRDHKEYEVHYDFDGDGELSALERAYAVAEKVLLFVEEHADEADAMDRWRLRLAKSVSHSDRELGQLSHKVDLLSSNLLTISRQVQAVASALQVTTQPVVAPVVRGLGMSGLNSPPSHSPVGRRASPPPPETRQMRSRSPAVVEVVAVAASVARSRDNVGSMAELPTPAPQPAPLNREQSSLLGGAGSQAPPPGMAP